MEEIKRRDQAIGDVLGGVVKLPAPIAADLCYVQLRKICEIIGLSCLVAHGDLEGVRTSALQKTYKPDFIIKQMERLHRDFYPMPGIQRLDLVTGRPVEILPMDKKFLDKAALIALYGECGDRLHRGNVRKLLAGQEPAVDFAKIAEWRMQAVNLLNHHSIQTSDPDWQFRIIMQASGTGDVQWSIWRKVNSKSSPTA